MPIFTHLNTLGKYIEGVEPVYLWSGGALLLLCVMFCLFRALRAITYVTAQAYRYLCTPQLGKTYNLDNWILPQRWQSYIEVVDGDTFNLITRRPFIEVKTPIRMEGYDTPEKAHGVQFYEGLKDLSNFLHTGCVRYKITQKDKYNRLCAIVWCREGCINHRMRDKWGYFGNNYDHLLSPYAKSMFIAE